MLFSPLLILAFYLTSTLPVTSDEGWSFWPRYRHYLRHLPREVSQTLFFRADTQRKIVAITFDDGPLANTSKLIRFLKARQTPATFFLPAGQLDARKARLYDDPLFETGIHGYRHDDFRRLSPTRTRRELERAIRRFERYHLRHDLFRPPYGMMSRSLARILQERRIRGVIWSLDSRDWSRRDRPDMTRRILDHLAPGQRDTFSRSRRHAPTAYRYPGRYRGQRVSDRSPPGSDAPPHPLSLKSLKDRTDLS